MNEEYSKGNTPRIMCVKHSYPALLNHGFQPWGCTILDPRSLDGISTHGIVRRTLFKTINSVFLKRKGHQDYLKVAMYAATLFMASSCGRLCAMGLICCP